MCELNSRYVIVGLVFFSDIIQNLPKTLYSELNVPGRDTTLTS